jgi:hypothetical protein
MGSKPCAAEIHGTVPVSEPENRTDLFRLHDCSALFKQEFSPASTGSALGE